MKQIKIISLILTIIFGVALCNEMIILKPDSIENELIVFNTLLAFLASVITFIITTLKSNNL